MTLSPHFLAEPLLEFANGQKVEHPQDGLFLYGPVDDAGSPEVLRVGVIGTPQGIGLVKGWLSKLAGRLPVKDRSKLHTSAWPGFQAIFAARLPGNGRKGASPALVVVGDERLLRIDISVFGGRPGGMPTMAP
jgi:hypothetical protein